MSNKVCSRVETWILKEEKSVKLTIDIDSVGDLNFGEVVGLFTQCLVRWKHVDISLQTAHSSLIELSPSIKDLVNLLKEHPSAFAFSP